MASTNFNDCYKTFMSDFDKTPDKMVEYFYSVDWSNPSNRDAFLEKIPKLDTPFGEPYLNKLIARAGAVGHVFEDEDFVHRFFKAFDLKTTALFNPMVYDFCKLFVRFRGIEFIFDNLDDIIEEIGIYNAYSLIEYGIGIAFCKHKYPEKINKLLELASADSRTATLVH